MYIGCYFIAFQFSHRECYSWIFPVLPVFPNSEDWLPLTEFSTSAALSAVDAESYRVLICVEKDTDVYVRPGELPPWNCLPRCWGGIISSVVSFPLFLDHISPIAGGQRATNNICHLTKVTWPQKQRDTHTPVCRRVTNSTLQIKKKDPSIGSTKALH